MSEQMYIYADNAATTMIGERTKQLLKDYIDNTDLQGNPSALHSSGATAEHHLRIARQEIARVINAMEHEIIFTSGGSESDNLAVRLAVESEFETICSSNIEHHAVSKVCEAFAKNRDAFDYKTINVRSDGLAHPSDLYETLTENPSIDFVSIMMVNNELGTIQPIKALVTATRLAETVVGHKIIFHTDAVQAIGHIRVDVKDLGVDMLSFSGHKFHALKGTGGLYISDRIASMLHKYDLPIYGGGQEQGLRSGTENVLGIMSMAAELTRFNELNGNPKRPLSIEKVRPLKDKLLHTLRQIPYSMVSCPDNTQMPNYINICFKDISSDSLVLALDSKGICVSGGSACNSNSLTPSEVLDAIGIPNDYSYGSLRITLGEDITEKEIDYMAKVIPEVVYELRKIGGSDLV